jgi:ubiquinone/menaquinone biosynthesis C-methylase UbiE
MAADFFERAYAGTPPWEIGRPQREFVALESSGQIKGDVLDVGCGTGENALFLAGRGHTVWGVDAAPAAIERARHKAEEQGITATFLVGDALNLQRIGKQFDTVIDSGLFHTLSDEERPCFARNLREVMHRGSMYFMLCFSEHEPGGYGPRRVTQAEIRQTFGDGWTVRSVRAAVFENRRSKTGAAAWLASIEKVP